MFHIYRFPSGACEIRFDFQDRHAKEIPPQERRIFISLSSSLEIGNAWLATLGADCSYATGTGYEYAKALLYTTEWLAQEPVNIATQEPVGHSLLALNRSDLRSLFAWLDIPAHQVAERTSLVKEGMLPAGYRKNAIAASTHNLRNAALTNFYDWILREYQPPVGITLHLTENPMKDMNRRHSRFQEMQRPDDLLPRSTHRAPDPSSVFRRRQSNDTTGPLVLTYNEVQLVLDALPLVSHGRNAANRNGALIRLLLWGMLRMEELVEARWEETDGKTLWITGKGRKRRAVPVADQSTWSYLQTYTDELLLPSVQRFHGPLLRQLDHEDRPITRHVIEHLLKALCVHFRARARSVANRTGYGNVQELETLATKLHSHIFRATGATYMAKAGMSLVMLSLLLGHSDPSTTMRYYIAAEHLSLPEEVERICAGIVAAGGTTASALSSSPDSRSWYARRGLIAGK